jgi:hypothetical protein
VGAFQVAPGRVLRTTPVFDTYWRFAARRQELFIRRLAGSPFPWTEDEVLATYRFTNCYRASDRVSQYLIREVLYKGEQSAEEIFFRCLLFKVFNRISTWERLVEVFGTPTWRRFRFERYARVLDSMMSRGQRVYSAAYIMPEPPLGRARKHRNHLMLLERMMLDGVPVKVERARSLADVFAILRSYPSIGDFLAFQYAIDLNYSDLLHFAEADYVIAGPGALDGIHKCFVDLSGLDPSDLIRAVADLADREFQRLDIQFPNLWGRALQPVDCQNLFCEVDKYARIVHPEYDGPSRRKRIKRKFTPNSAPLLQWYPPKWRLDVPDSLGANI